MRGGATLTVASRDPPPAATTTFIAAAIPAARPRVGTTFLVPGVLLFSLVFIRTPALFGDEAPVEIYALSLAPFALAIAAELVMVHASWRIASVGLLAGGYLALVIVAAFHGAYHGAVSESIAWYEAVQLSLLAGLAMLAFLRDPCPGCRARNVRALCWAPAVFVALNVAMYFAGFLPTGQYDPETRLPATMLGIVGIGVNRVQFPLASGLNGIGPTAVVALVVCAVIALRGERRLIAVAGVTVSLYVVLAIDSRGALLFAGLALLLVIVTPRARKRRLSWVAVALPVVPVVLVLALTGLAETEAGVQLERGGQESLSTGTGRTVVWGEIANVFKEPSVDHVFGYGQNGHVTSGASVGYAYLFAGEENPLSRSAHNVLLQTLLTWAGSACSASSR